MKPAPKFTIEQVRYLEDTILNLLTPIYNEDGITMERVDAAVNDVAKVIRSLPVNYLESYSTLALEQTKKSSV